MSLRSWEPPKTVNPFGSGFDAQKPSQTLLMLSNGLEAYPKGLRTPKSDQMGSKHEFTV